MTRPSPDWFGKPDPELEREFLNELNAVHMQIAYRDFFESLMRHSAIDQRRAQGLSGTNGERFKP